MTSHLHGPNEHYSRTGSGETGGGGGSSGDRRFQMRVALIGAAGAIIAAAVGAVIGLKPWSHPGPSPPGGGGSTPASFPSGTYSTHLGRALTLTNGTVPVTVRLTRIVDPATGDNNFLKSGDRYLATEFRVSDPATQPVGIWAFEEFTTVVGSDGQTYAADQVETVSECTSFHDGAPQIVSGQSVAECVVFQMPTGVSAREVQVTDGNERGIWRNP